MKSKPFVSDPIHHPLFRKKLSDKILLSGLLVFLFLHLFLFSLDSFAQTSEQRTNLPPASNSKIDSLGTTQQSGSASTTQSSEIDDLKKLFGITKSENQTEKDTIPPEIYNLTPQTVEDPYSIIISARILDNKAIAEVYLNYKKVGEQTDYLKAPLKQMGDPAKGYFEISLPPSALGDKGIHYFIEAIDADGNTSYSTLDLSTPHLLTFKQKSITRWIIILALSIIIIPTLIIFIRRKVQSTREEQRTVQLRKFISRQKTLEKERKRLYKKHMKKFHGYRHQENEEEDEGDTESDLLEEEEVEEEPTRTKQKEMPKRGSSTTTPPTQKLPKTPTQRPEPTPAPKEKPQNKKIEDLLNRLDQKIDKSRGTEKSSFDINSEAIKLLSDINLFQAQSSETSDSIGEEAIPPIQKDKPKKNESSNTSEIKSKPQKKLDSIFGESDDET